MVQGSEDGRVAGLCELKPLGAQVADCADLCSRTFSDVPDQIGSPVSITDHSKPNQTASFLLCTGYQNNSGENDRKSHHLLRTQMLAEQNDCPKGHQDERQADEQGITRAEIFC